LQIKASVDPAGLPKLVTEAMTAIGADFESLLGDPPKDYARRTRLLEKPAAPTKAHPQADGYGL